MTSAAVRALLDAAFGGEFSEDDWQHCLGGTSFVALEGGEAVAHGAVVPRTLTHEGVELRCGYVEGLAVRADRRGRGLGAGVMAAIEAVIGREFELGALSTTEKARGFYEARGWQRWRGPTVPEDDGSVYVLPVSARLDVRGKLVADQRAGVLW